MNLTTQPIPATNFMAGRDGQSVDTFVYHWIDGKQAVADYLFQIPGRQVSAHFSIEDDAVHQYVRLSDTAFHAGNWAVNLRSVGIEHSAEPGRDASEATYESSAQTVHKAAQALGKSVGDFRHVPHSSVVATACPGTIDIARIVARAKEIEARAAALPTAAPVPPAVDAITVSATARALPTFTATVTVPQLRVRVAPSTASAERPDKLLRQGDRLEISEAVSGQDPYGDGRNVWLHTKVSGLFIWAAGTDYQQPNAQA